MFLYSTLYASVAVHAPGNKRGLDNKSGMQTENGLERGFALVIAIAGP